MPTFISIAIERPRPYVAIDDGDHVWRVDGGSALGAPMVMTWEPVTSEFSRDRRDLHVWRRWLVGRRRRGAGVRA
jgi:hypothetical protein